MDAHIRIQNVGEKTEHIGCVRCSNHAQMRTFKGKGMGIHAHTQGTGHEKAIMRMPSLLAHIQRCGRFNVHGGVHDDVGKSGIYIPPEPQSTSCYRSVAVCTYQWTHACPRWSTNCCHTDVMLGDGARGCVKQGHAHTSIETTHSHASQYIQIAHAFVRHAPRWGSYSAAPP